MNKEILEKRKKLDKLLLNIRKSIEIDLDDEEYKKEFFIFIEKLREIKPFDNEEYVKYNKFNDKKLSCIFVNYRMNHIKYLTEIKKYILEENWYMVLESISELDRGCEILSEKIYYSIIDVL